VSDTPRDPADAPAVVPWYHWVWVLPAALFLRVWLSTLRFRCNVEKIDDSEGPSVLLLWHDKLFVSSWIANRYFKRPVTALISTSKDGAWLVAFFKLMGITAVRGSSSRRGAAALMTLTRSMRAGQHAGITPDGPKGPALEFKPGAVSLARLTGRPFMVLGIRYHACWRTRSWDRFGLPMPFSKVEVTLHAEPKPAEGEADEVVAARLQARLNETSTGPA
jgi:lysophospholipid acyltransferase (LPLAT)-like uncharacterized protein